MVRQKLLPAMLDLLPATGAVTSQTTEHRQNDFFENGVDDLFSVAQIKVRILCQDALGKFGFDHVLYQSMPEAASVAFL
jgi:hypothetical protein